MRAVVALSVDSEGHEELRVPGPGRGTADRRWSRGWFRALIGCGFTRGVPAAPCRRVRVAHPRLLHSFHCRAMSARKWVFPNWEVPFGFAFIGVLPLRLSLLSLFLLSLTGVELRAARWRWGDGPPWRCISQTAGRCATWHSSSLLLFLAPSSPAPFPPALHNAD
ncbi:hypothetical protein C8R47DRAFT_1105159 [Mycena vitilis]|nr:hypothetical protein C8R47DRAFT_1105159 [Mycena vitilis]